MKISEESRALLNRLAEQYRTPPATESARGTTKSTVVLAKQMEFFRAHIFLNRILNGEYLTEKDWEKELQSIEALWLGEEEQIEQAD